MSLGVAILCGIIYWLAEANLPFVGLWTLQRPLVCGFLTGCLLGQPVTGAVVGATINLVYLGFISAGGSMPADMALAGVLGVAYAITGNLDADTALAIAVPIGLLGTIVWYLRMTIDSVFVHMGDKWVAEGKFNNLYLSNVILPQIFSAIICVTPCTLAAYFGADYIQSFIDMCAGKPLQIFQDQRITGSWRHHACTWYCNHTAVHLQRRGSYLPVLRIYDCNSFWNDTDRAGYCRSDHGYHLHSACRWKDSSSCYSWSTS